MNALILMLAMLGQDDDYLGIKHQVGEVITTKPTAVSVDYFTALELRKYALADDLEGIKQLKDKGKIAHIEETKCRLLEKMTTTPFPGSCVDEIWQVRILDGPYKDKELWILGAIIKEPEKPKEEPPTGPAKKKVRRRK